MVNCLMNMVIGSDDKSLSTRSHSSCNSSIKRPLSLLDQETSRIKREVQLKKGRRKRTKKENENDQKTIT